MIYCPEEFQPDILNTFCATRFQKLKILQDQNSKFSFTEWIDDGSGNCSKEVDLTCNYGFWNHLQKIIKLTNLATTDSPFCSGLILMFQCLSTIVNSKGYYFQAVYFSRTIM